MYKAGRYHWFGIIESRSNLTMDEAQLIYGIHHGLQGNLLPCDTVVCNIAHVSHLCVMSTANLRSNFDIALSLFILLLFLTVVSGFVYDIRITQN